MQEETKQEILPPPSPEPEPTPVVVEEIANDNYLPHAIKEGALHMDTS